MTTKVTGSILANTAVTAGRYGGANTVGTFTVDAQGRLIDSGNTTIAITSTNLDATGVTGTTYGGGVSSANFQLPVVTVDTKGRITAASNVTVTSTAIYANSNQLVANAATGVVQIGLAIPSPAPNAGSYGAFNKTAVFQVDAYGRVTSISEVLISGGSAGTGSTTYNRTTVTATAGQTTFSNIPHTVGYLQVYVNGVLLTPNDYTANAINSTVVLTTAASTGDQVEAFAYTTTLANNLSPGTTGGSAGTVLYQSAANTTSNTAVGTSTYLLQSNGTGAPTWVNPATLTVSSATTFSSTTSNSQFFSIGVGTAASSSAGEIRATGTITAGYSDDQLKTKLGNIGNPLNKLMTLNGFYFEPNQLALDLGYTLSKQVGVSAQEVQKVLPEVVVLAPIDNKYLTVQYDRMIPLLIEAIKELKSEVEVLKGQIK
jgi:hypothetical protein